MLVIFLALLEDEALPKLAIKDVTLGDVIGGGAQGYVYKAKYKGKDVAAKTMFITDDQTVIKFAQEIKLLRHVTFDLLTGEAC